MGIGVGKTEIARRLAKMVNAPFVKVEATKFTQVGYHGRDVDQIIRDLVEVSILQTKKTLRMENREQIERAVEDKILAMLIGETINATSKEQFREFLRAGMLDDRKVTVEVHQDRNHMTTKGVGKGIQIDFREIFQFISNEKPEREMTVKEAKQVLEEQEVDKMFDSHVIIKRAKKLAEDNSHHR